jgi:hypothetical protein
MSTLSRLWISVAVCFAAIVITLPAFASGSAAAPQQDWDCDALDRQPWEEPYCCDCDFLDPESIERTCVQDPFFGFRRCVQEPWDGVCWHDFIGCQAS